MKYPFPPAAFSCALITLALNRTLLAAEAGAALNPAAFPGADLFANGIVASVRIEISDSNLKLLGKEARDFVPATITESRAVYSNVAVHLKGSVGSFRPIQDKPAWTLDFSRFHPGQKFHGLRRIHLNNSVEDLSYCNERLGSELFRAAGVPAPRVSRAVVTLNGRRLGLYVLKEGFTEDFLACCFSHPSGNLYEPDEGHDVNQRLKRNSVQAPRKDRGALRALADLVLDPDRLHRWQRLEPVLATDEFISFMAMEILVCHRDGYCLARNNFRVYEDLDTGKIAFFPQGMDQLWGNPAAPWRPQMAGLVARAIMETSEGEAQYRRRLGTLVTNLLQPDFLARRVDQLVEELHPVADPAEFGGVQQAATLLKQRIAQRRASLDAQLRQPDLKVLAFEHGHAQVTGWTRCEEPAKGNMETCKSPDGISSLHILTRSQTAASWRTKALLSRGAYRFEGQVKVSGVKALPFGAHHGAGLRLGGSSRQSADLLGDSAWRPLQAEFEVTVDTEEIEFICELRATAGEVWFDESSLQLVHMR